MEEVNSLEKDSTKKVEDVRRYVDYNENEIYRGKCEEIDNVNDYEFFEPAEFSKNFITWLEPLEKIEDLATRIVNKGVKSGEAFLLFENWLKDVRDYLIRNAAYMFRIHYEEIMEGTYEGDLFSLTGNEECLKVVKQEDIEDIEENPGNYFPGTVAADMLNIMKSIMRDNVYDSTEIINLEISAKGAIETLLDTFTDTMLRYKPKKCEETETTRAHYTIEDCSGMGVVYDRFIHVIPDNLLLDFVHKYTLIMDSDVEDKESEILYYRLLTVTDFVSGMTDSYATNLAKLIRGID
jgi:dGTPase